MGNIEIPGGCVIAKPPEYYGRKSLKPLTARVPRVDEPRVDGAGTTRPSPGTRRSACCTSCSPPWRHRSPTASAPTSPTATIRSRHARCGGDQAGAGQAQAARLDRRALLGDGLVFRRHPPRGDLPRARQHPGSAARPGPGLLHARPGDRAALRQPPGVVDLPGDPAPHGHEGSARLRDDRRDLELPARGHRRHRRRDARDGLRRAWPTRRS